MNLWFRMVWVILGALLTRPRLSHWTSLSRIRLHVWPNDLDTNFHLNNGRYLTIMDLGRFDLLLRSGLWAMVRRAKAVPILASAQIRYRFPLDAFDPFYLESQVMGWDAKWIYIVQHFIAASGVNKGKVAAVGLVKAAFFDPARKSTIPTAEIMQNLGEEGVFPPLPPVILSFQEAESDLRDYTAQAVSRGT
ncbi:MAG: thioesterase family protein [Pseudomonadota bacterium]